eukprot:7589246-Alexandrium_andersonii.AAC.1
MPFPCRSRSIASRGLRTQWAQLWGRRPSGTTFLCDEGACPTWLGGGLAEVWPCLVDVART